MATLIKVPGRYDSSQSWTTRAGPTDEFASVYVGVVGNSATYPAPFLRSIIVYKPTNYYGKLSVALYRYNTKEFVVESPIVNVVAGGFEVDIPFSSPIPLTSEQYAVVVKNLGDTGMTFDIWMYTNAWDSGVIGAGTGWWYGPPSNPFKNYSSSSKSGGFGATFWDSNPNAAPNAPTMLSPISNQGSLINPRPKVIFKVTDPEGDKVIALAQVARDAAFTNLVLFEGSDSYPASFSPSGWINSGSNVYWTPSADIAPGTYYVRTWAYDGVSWGAYSATVVMTIAAPNWTNPTINDNDPGIRATWITELRTLVNNTRRARGITVAAFTDATVTANSSNVRIVHINELRTAINALLSASNLAPPAYTDPTLTANVTERKGIHIKQLRDALARC
ncbi:hypothetical protein [Cohnella abietis]|uniref:Uncharacterized protein n=1 Tax=Cohnella abietis TaxID=2507935 RepID=A0A3T1D1Y0_9BACL|nr:hypothetical protein [Cohnella abietis]BBI32058.1 hypothetical protein KCTCHS21_14570 [Cohnella abietis]